jgi:hypothetical protein
VTKPVHSHLEERVVEAAEAVLKNNGSVGLLELFQEMGWLHSGCFEGWRRGHEGFRAIEKWIQAGQGKRDKAILCFNEWAKRRGLRALETSYTRSSPRGSEALRITEDGDPEREKVYRMHYAPADLPDRKAARLAEKLGKAPDLVVFEKVSEEGRCGECGTELARGGLLFMEMGRPLCLACADLDHLVFLPAGDMALSRRARKHSPLSAVVVRFSRSRRRYERQGLLVGESALARAEQECAADAPERALARERAAGLRREEDREFVDVLTGAILQQYPGCPQKEARCIARHTGQRSSGRVGRSAAGRALDPRAIDLAVVAHVRHEHTDYDRLLMQGTDRLDARMLVREEIDRVLARWSAR